MLNRLLNYFLKLAIKNWSISKTLMWKILGLRSRSWTTKQIWLSLRVVSSGCTVLGTEGGIDGRHVQSSADMPLTCASSSLPAPGPEMLFDQRGWRMPGWSNNVRTWFMRQKMKRKNSQNWRLKIGVELQSQNHGHCPILTLLHPIQTTGLFHGEIVYRTSSFASSLPLFPN
jgi:hypothetical protein